MLTRNSGEFQKCQIPDITKCDFRAEQAFKEWRVHEQRQFLLEKWLLEVRQREDVIPTKDKVLSSLLVLSQI